MTVTQSQIARELGVDQRTVSIALGSSGRISDQMRQKVLITAEKMGYRPNHLAAGLRGGKTQSIGIIWLFADAWMGDASIALSILTHAQQQGYQVFQAQLPDATEHICKQIDEMLARRVDALIIQGSVRQLSDPAILKRLKMAPAVVAVCPQAIENFPGDLVIHDRFEAICQVVDHFAATGRKRPVFLTEMSQEHNPPKYHAFAQRCEKHGIAHDNMLLSLHPVTDPDQMGMRHLSVFLERYPNTVEDIDSVFMFNDIGALYIMRELQQRGIDVPKQIAVVGFNDMETGRIWQPALATGNRKRDEVSNTIKQMLDTRLSQSDMPPQTQTVHMQFIYRESAG